MNKCLIVVLLFGIMACKQKNTTSSSGQKSSFGIKKNVENNTLREIKYTFISSAQNIKYDYFLPIDSSYRDKKKDILYYFERLPPLLLYQEKNSSKSVNQFKNNISHQNISNGYLKLKFPPQPGSLMKETYELEYYELEIALFIDKKGTNIIGINNLNNGELVFISLNNNIWNDITTDIFPDFSCKEPPCGGEPTRYYKLPEYGTTILTTFDGNFIIPSPVDTFWKHKSEKYPEQIRKVVWNMKQGKFLIKD